MATSMDRVAQYTVGTCRPTDTVRVGLEVSRAGAIRQRVLVHARAPQAVADHHAGRTVEPILQDVSDRTEAVQPHPARFHRARAGHTVALTLLSHLRLYMLLYDKKEGKKQSQH